VLIRQRDSHNLRAQPFTTMIVDSSSQIFEFAPRGSISRSMIDVRSAQIAVQLGEHLVAEKPQQLLYPARCLPGSGLRRALCPGVKRKYVSYWDLRGITRAFARLGEVLSVEIFDERSFSSFTIIFAAACALCMFSIADDPHRVV
jgi:hypothetical protein